jgi:hypothetical protein|tara:strand:- start:509 stop:706 length:198 start_codon:yes stop_codon:yes gene_type:complete
MKTAIYYVELHGGGGRWFADRAKAIFFAQCLCNTESITVNHPPLYEHIIDLEPEWICKWLNKREL